VNPASSISRESRAQRRAPSRPELHDLEDAIFLVVARFVVVFVQQVRVYVDQARQYGQRAEVHDLHARRDDHAMSDCGDPVPFDQDDRVTDDGAGADVDQAVCVDGEASGRRSRRRRPGGLRAQRDGAAGYRDGGEHGVAADLAQ